MEQVFVGNTGLSVSRLALGTMSFGGDADEQESGRLYARCREVGINFFDCADVYQQGRAEQILGGLIRSERDQLVIASKAGFPMGKDQNARGASRYHLVRACEASLKRLGIDRIDLYYVHRFDGATDLGETVRALELLTQQGKILYAGVSNFAAWQVQRALGLAQGGPLKIAALQPMYNLLKRQVEVELLPMAQFNQLAVFPYSPLAGGLLSGKFVTGKGEETSRLNTNKAYQVRYANTQSDQVVRAFLKIAQQLDVHPATLAVAWIMAHPGVTAPLLGARNVAQLEPSLKALELKLDPDTRQQISALTAAPQPATDRNDDGTETDLFRR